MNEQMSHASIFKDYIVPAFAILGATQLWFVALWRRFFRQLEVDIRPTNIVEIGYSMFGPTVGFFGTLVAVNRNAYVDHIALVVRRNLDGAQHQFDWVAFRSNQFVFGGTSQGVTAELPSGFMIAPTQPHRYNILFSDRQRWQEMRGHMIHITQEWTSLHQSVSTTVGAPNTAQLFNTLVTGGSITSSWSTLNRLCYWESGAYSLEITVQTLRPDRHFTLRQQFSITEEDAERLRTNALVITAELCGQPGAVYNFAYGTLSQ